MFSTDWDNPVIIFFFCGLSFLLSIFFLYHIFLNQKRKNFYPAAVSETEWPVIDVFSVGDNAFFSLFCFKQGVDAVHDSPCRAERNIQMNGSEFTDSFIKIMVHFIKFGRICTLKAVNRLFTIPDNKNCARQGIFITSLSGKELLCQCPNNSPLVWGGILRFVN